MRTGRGGQDPEKLMELIREIDSLLEQKEQGLMSQRKADG
jgi:hypothetical protein